jgi:hypothetical protein
MLYGPSQEPWNMTAEAADQTIEFDDAASISYYANTFSMHRRIDRRIQRDARGLSWVLGLGQIHSRWIEITMYNEL